ncbi:MAG: transketolase [Planctomycetes bacterium]|nr:transketolase [Planctomycetota bacterium]MCB9917045.1 transketolase [Planctomycetota bacterium]
MSEVTKGDRDLTTLCVNAVRVLSMDAVQQANSGHPGTPMALAPLAYVLFTKHLKHDPADPNWPNRDRFVLSCGHASMLLYSVLYLSGYEISSDEIRNFRQWGARTPGHPEFGLTPGVETTTGPLGQGLANAVGMAIAETKLSTTFNHTGHYVLDHHTWFIASDGDLMEGISHEAASLAGHLGLGKLIGFWDDNSITIEGERSLADSDDVAKRFDAYGWQVLHVEDGNDVDAIDDAIDAAKAELHKPSLIIVKTIIGYGAPHKQNTADAHGAPLGANELLEARKQLGWEYDEPFFVPVEALHEWGKCKDRGEKLQQAWIKTFHTYRKAFPADADTMIRRLAGKLPESWEDALPDVSGEITPAATRSVSGRVLSAIAERVPELFGGSADLGPSNNTLLEDGGDFSATNREGRNLHFGVREHAMGAICNGMALHGGIIPYAGTFLVFSDYMRPALRLAAMMELGTIAIYTHDSIGLGEDGPTHQPIETLAALRAIPNFTVLRPADAAETVEAWRYAMKHRHGPCALVLTRQKVPPIERQGDSLTSDVAHGAYVVSEAQGDPSIVLIGTGSEVQHCLGAQSILRDEGIEASVVSCPSLEIFARQQEEYRRSVLPVGVPRLVVEAAHPQSWGRILGDHGDMIGLEHFGASAPAPKLFEEFGFTAENVAARARKLLAPRI